LLPVIEQTLFVWQLQHRSSTYLLHLVTCNLQQPVFFNREILFCFLNDNICLPGMAAMMIALFKEIASSCLFAMMNQIQPT